MGKLEGENQLIEEIFAKFIPNELIPENLEF